jgi:hypothetical protein
MPVDIAFKSFADSLDNPLKSPQDFLINADLKFFGRAEQLHIGLEAILMFFGEHNKLPELNNEEHAKEVIKMAMIINEEAKKVILHYLYE